MANNSEVIEKKEEVKEVKEIKPVDSEVIGELKQDKKKPITVFIMMGILVLFAIFLPYISDLIKEGNFSFNLPKVPAKEPVKKPEAPVTPIEPEIEEEVYYDLTKGESITEGKVVYSNFKINSDTDNYLGLTVVNNGTESINFNTKKLYLELYDITKTLLERVKIINSESLLAGGSSNLKLYINKGTSASLIKLVEYKENDYPAFIVNPNSDNKYLLTCTNLQSKLVYEFVDNKLTTINETFDYTNDNLTTYAEVLTNYKNKAKKFNEVSGMTASVAESGVNFSFNATASLDSTNALKLNEPTYFAKDTDAKIINFEMEAMRFNCE